MNVKKFIFITISTCLVALILIGSLNVIIDPLFQYHKPWFNLEPVITDERYQNAGVARNFDYDNVIIGNSMCENFKPSDFNDCFEGATVKLTASGSHSIDWTYLLKIIQNKEHYPKNIIMNFDSGIMEADPDNTKHDLPTFLYDNNYINDVNYLFNFSILKNYTFEFLRANFHGEVPDIDSAFVWDDGVTRGKEFVLSDYERPAITDVASNADDSVELAIKNINNLLPYFETMKETNFILFFSPFSIVYWDKEIRLNEIDLWKTVFTEVFKILVEYDNVHLLFWTDEEMFDIITNLNNYKDATHYTSEISLEIVDRIYTRFGRLTVDNYGDEIEKFFKYITEYDYSVLFEQ